MKYKLLLILLFFPFFMFAQQLWSLQDCLKHAAEHNLSIKQAALNTTLTMNALTQSKLGLLPSLNTNASHSFNFGRNIDPYTNTLRSIGLGIIILVYLQLQLYLLDFKI